MTSTPDEVSYCTREQVQETLGQADSVRNNRVIDRAILAASRDLEGELHRRFYPTLATRYPPVRWVSGDTLYLNHIDYELLGITSLTVDGVTLVEGTDFYLHPEVPPHTSIRLYRDANAAWPSDPRDIVIVGPAGGSNGAEPAGALAAAISTTTATQMTVSDSSAVGVGDLVLVGAERVIVTEKEVITSGETVTGTVAASNAGTTIPVSDGSAFHYGETILVGAERMFVEQVAGNNLVVKRAVNASTLAAHVNTDVVYVPRLCTIRRGVAGTTAAVHADAAVLERNRPPGLVNETAVAASIVYAEQGKAGWPGSRTTGSGDNARPAAGGSIEQVWARAYMAYGRKGRIGVC